VLRINYGSRVSEAPGFLVNLESGSFDEARRLGGSNRSRASNTMSAAALTQIGGCDQV
jgi:hypothetical protein